MDPPDRRDRAGDPLAVLAHALNNPLAVLVANLDLLQEALDEGGDALRPQDVGESIREARIAADRIRMVIRRAQGLSGDAEVPAQPAPADAGGGAGAQPARADERCRILVIDDDIAVGQALARGLRKYDVDVLDNAHRALERFAAGERFDLIVCDLAMPEMTGMDLYEEAVQLAPEQAQSFVFVTGGATDSRTRDFVSSVPNVVLQKPFDVNRLRELIRHKTGAHRQSKRVMVVDDDVASRKLVVRWLTESHYECAEHASGRDALRELTEHPDRFDVVVLDVMMPGADGFEVVARMKGDPALAHIPVILLTAQAVGDADIARGMAAGAEFYLTKPCRGPVLVAEVAAACARAAAEWELRMRLQFAEDSATRDALTGVMNRRAFEARLRDAVSNTTRHREALAVVMLDIDYFKKVNDSFGHEGGDRMLLYFARVLRRTVRLGDQVFRYGGEEFALLLPKCDVEGAKHVVARVQATLRAKPVVLVEGQPVVVRFSAGIATAEAKNEFRVEDLVGRADAALYAAKRAGRDRIEAEP
jgi:two-component system cell cycle response regulator